MKQFIKAYNIDDEALKLAANHMEYIRIPKNNYVYQGEFTENFYSVINGRISMRKLIELKVSTKNLSRSLSSNNFIYFTSYT